jgi:capsular polysaccharide biosynthesis protein
LIGCKFLKRATIAPIIRHQPFEEIFGGGHSGSYGGGIYMENNIFHPIGVERYGRECVLNGHPPEVVPVRHEKEKVIFGGYLFMHYGHFILESTARLWARQFFPVEKFVFIMQERASLYQQQIDCLKIFGNYEIVGDEAISYEDLIIPEPSFVMGKPISFKGSLDYLRYKFKSIKSEYFSGEKIYLSRSKINKRKCNNETDFENELRDLGFLILFPEEMTFYDQINIFNNAKVVVGLLGSSWHTLIFASPEINSTRIYLDFRNNWGDSYSFIEEQTQGKSVYSKCLIRLSHDNTGPYNADYSIDIPMALNEVKKYN